jgi:hypothetical protein
VYVAWKPDGLVGGDAKDFGVGSECVHKGLTSRKRFVFGQYFGGPQVELLYESYSGNSEKITLHPLYIVNTWSFIRRRGSGELFKNLPARISVLDAGGSFHSSSPFFAIKFME